MKKYSYLFVILVFFSFYGLQANEVVWGKTGHRTTGHIAQKHLSRKAKKEIKKLLGGQNLATASTYADEIKSDEVYRKYSAWHYVNFSFGTKYGDEPLNPGGDIISGINTCKEVLQNPNSTRADKVFYLKLLIHFIGDLHQPLHCGKASDKGGNDFQVRWFDQGTNLHKVWDSKMIDSYGMSYTELAESIDVVSKKRRQQWQEGSILDWAYESQALADKVYKSAKSGEKLKYSYSYENLDTVKQQLLKGGIRLAGVLNEIFR
ncbi:S1/P1 nuclease [Spongiivirga citrea]|uniref:S1/P1 Nuclease n=1 Tax=Spongiivirga citrea TaxID=1481457 RepID=A0A6M0CT66_9FLAO|nr:S1/P1 nuclease [Spongiivirga citrea]NER19129.1 S1/P1 Nuclease [Spongiivirga citrea]